MSALMKQLLLEHHCAHSFCTVYNCFHTAIAQLRSCNTKLEARSSTLDPILSQHYTCSLSKFIYSQDCKDSLPVRFSPLQLPSSHGNPMQPLNKSKTELAIYPLKPALLHLPSQILASLFPPPKLLAGVLLNSFFFTLHTQNLFISLSKLVFLQLAREGGKPCTYIPKMFLR